MPRDININRGQLVTGNIISGNSHISNHISEQADVVTPEMWATLQRLVDTYGKPPEVDGLQQMKMLVEQGEPQRARSIWQHLRSFLQDFANVSKIVETVDALMR